MTQTTSHKTLFFVTASTLLLAGLAGAVFVFHASSETQETAAISPLDDYFYGKQNGDYLTYTHPEHGFSFDLPNDFLVSSFEEDGKEIILAEHPRLHAGFQIVISPFDEDPASLTQERILKDLPSLVMKDVWEFLIADDTPALRFASKDPSLGDTRELWFARDGNLYQVRMHAEDPTWLDPWIRQLASRFYIPLQADDL